MDESMERGGAKLADWVRRALGEVATTFEAPTPEVRGTCVCLYPYGLENLMYRYRPTHRRPANGFRLRYLVTAWAPSSLEAQSILEKLYFSAGDEGDFEVEPTANDVLLWLAIGILPRPAFFLLASVQQEREEQELPLARQPPRLHTSPGVPSANLVGEPPRANPSP